MVCYDVIMVVWCGREWERTCLLVGSTWGIETCVSLETFFVSLA